MSALWREIRVSIRTLLKAPGFSLAAVAALALGIGPNIAIFSIVYSTLFAPLPYPDAHQLVIVWSRVGESREMTSPADYLDWKQQARSFQYLEPIWVRFFNLSTPQAPMRVRARQTSAGGFSMWGQGVLLGRAFQQDEDQPGKNQVVLLSHELWRRGFGADPGIVGRDIRMDGVPYTVIGVLEPGINDRVPADLWIPLTLRPEDIENRKFRPLLVVGRLRPEATVERAQKEMDAIAQGLAQRFPASNTGRTVRVESLQNNFLRADVARNLWLLLAAVSFVMLIACVNVANLLLSRGATREREHAIHTALGATRGRLVRRILTESLVLAAAGGLLGALSSAWLLRAILAILPPRTLPSEADPRLSLPVLLFALAITSVCGLLCGAAQAWHATRTDTHETLKQAGRGTTGLGRRRLLHTLVIAEFALAVTLLTGAGLTILSFWNRTQVDHGFVMERILTFELPVNEGRLTSPAEIEGFYRQLLERLQVVPGVRHASLSAPGLPFLSTGVSREFRIVGLTDDSTSVPSVGALMVTPAYFETFGLRLVRGRTLSAQDGPTTQRVALVNERFVERFLQGRDPLGQRVVMEEIEPVRSAARPTGSRVEWHIVGVLRNVNSAERFGDPTRAQIYLPFAQSPQRQVVAAVRTATSPEAVRTSVAAAVQSIDPDLPVTGVRTMEEIVSEQLSPDRLNMALYGGLAAVALVLAALGIYGVMAFTVAQRTTEIGLRMALGATPVRIRAHILREGAMLAAAGLGLGLVGAYALGRSMHSMLYGTGGLSLPVFLVVGLVLLAAALVACYVPAHRASAVDPMIALRST